MKWSARIKDVKTIEDIWHMKYSDDHVHVLPKVSGISTHSCQLYWRLESRSIEHIVQEVNISHPPQTEILEHTSYANVFDILSTQYITSIENTTTSEP